MKDWFSRKHISMNTLRRAATLLALLGVGAWAATARTEDKIGLKLVKVDSEETAGEDGKGANATDGDPATFWHTQWQDSSPSHPHEIIIELTPPSAIKGFTYLPRQDDNVNGTIKDYEFYVSTDGKSLASRSRRALSREAKRKRR